MIAMDHGIITYRETPLPLALRVFIAVIGLGVGLGIPAAWLANASLSHPVWTWFLLGAVVIISAGFGGVLVILSLASATELRIDPGADSVTRIRRGPLVNDTTTYPRSLIGPPVLKMQDSEDGPYPVLRLPMPGKRSQEMANFANRAEAEVWLNRITAALTA